MRITQRVHAAITGKKTPPRTISNTDSAVASGESSQDFNQMLVWMLSENPPQTTEEARLVSRLAEYFWLTQRVQGMKTDTFRALHEPESYGCRTHD